jgi:hypothetical protein
MYTKSRFLFAFLLAGLAALPGTPAQAPTTAAVVQLAADFNRTADFAELYSQWFFPEPEGQAYFRGYSDAYRQASLRLALLANGEQP